MNTTNTTKQVNNILKQLCGIAVIENKMRLSDDLGLDSLGLVTLLILLEERLHIELQESDMDPFSLITVKDVRLLAQKYTGGNAL